MNKIILKASLITLGVLSAAAILVFSLWILISPRSMATVSERTGNYKFAVVCADLSFRYSDDTEDLSRCADDSILSGENELIVKYCARLVVRDDFLQVCTSRDKLLSDTQYGEYAADYRTYILGNLAAAQYRTGDLNSAIATAASGKETCFGRLAIEVAQNGSRQDKRAVLDALISLDESEYVNGLVDLLIK